MATEWFAHTMVPADEGRSMADLIQVVLHNIDQFDKRKVTVQANGDRDVAERTYRGEFFHGLAMIAARQGWTAAQVEQVRGLIRRCPPDRVYRVRGGVHSATRGHSPLGVIVSYRPGRGAPEAAVMALGAFALGSAAEPLVVTADGLEDVTEAARRFDLPELR